MLLLLSDLRLGYWNQRTTLAIFLTPLYKLSPKQIGSFYLTPIVAPILGLAVEHWLHDFTANRYVKSRNGYYEPEARSTAI
jgi:hypothetical protein